VLVKVLAPGFFAREDTRTPVLVAAVSLAVNLAAILLLIGPLGHAGIALATAASAWCNATLLALLLWRRGGLVVDGRLRRRLPATVAAAAIMGGMLLGLDRLLADLAPLVRLGLLVPAGMTVYFAAARLLGAVDGSDLQAVLRRPATPAAGGP
jgi:putative peptidoglycan lipid II flippase